MAKRSTFTEVECRAFADAANPHQWLLTADSLHEQAIDLYHRRKESGFLRRHGANEPAVVWDNTNRATFLLCALALENAIKAFLVYEHPEWVSEGFLHEEMCSHRLVTLGGRSTLIPYGERDRWVLAAFEDGNESWMRYPCGRRANDVQEEQAMPEKLWAGYIRVMRGYGTKLIRLLGKGWTGPHGAGGGYWEMAGQWLGGGTPLPRNYRLPRIGGR
ncbi:MAG: hypothetical protein JWP50_1945 [Phenylobacterium sp.]|nr:hypothetical protein [Phenylobacterium sp.]